MDTGCEQKAAILADPPAAVAATRASGRHRDSGSGNRAEACHRVLLYARGLGLDARTSLSLAEASVALAEDGAPLGRVMDEMDRLLLANGLDAIIRDQDDLPLRSAPPLRRTSMTSGDSGRLSVFRAASMALRAFFGVFVPRRPAWAKRKP